MRLLKTLSITVAVCALAVSQASAVQMINFDYADNAAAQADWAVSGDYAGGGNSAPVLTASTADKAEGSAALGVSYTYTSSPYYQANLVKTYATPIDVSQTKRFSYQMKLSANAASDMVFIFAFRSSNGYAARRVVWSGLPSGSWTTVNFDLTQLERDPWNPHSPWSQPNLADIKTIEISWQKNDTNTNSGTCTMLFDDLQADSAAASVVENVVDDFEYADNAALQAAWVPANSNVALSTLAVSTTTSAASGSKAMDILVGNIQQDYTYGVSRTFATPQDFSSFNYWKIYMKGISSSGTGMILLYLKDQSGNAMRAWFNQSLTPKNSYGSFFISNSVAPAANPNNPSTHYGEYQDEADWGASAAVQTWHQDRWDAGELVDANLTQITQIIIYVMGGTGTGASVGIDRLAWGVVNTSAVSDWSVY